MSARRESGSIFEIFEIRVGEIGPVHSRAGGEAVEFGVVVEGEIEFAAVDGEFVVGGFGLGPVGKVFRAFRWDALFKSDGHLRCEGHGFRVVLDPETRGLDAEEQ
jgi:hypothetical protein